MDAKTADFFVIRHGEVNRHLQVTRDKFGNRRRGNGQKPLHVANATAKDLAIALRQSERIGGPRLAIYRDNVGVPR